MRRGALHDAARWDHAEVAEVLLGRGADINAGLEAGWTPLHRAASHGHTEVANPLRQHGAKE